MGNESDAAIAREAQERYLATGSQEDLAEIYSACRRMARRVIARQMAARGFSLTEEQADEKAHDAASRIAERFMKRKGFRMKKPASYAYLCALEALYHRRKVDRIVDFVPQDILEGKGDDQEDVQ